MKKKQCPCYSGKLYTECCQPVHDGALPADALALMRSRYSAYALNHIDYIIETTDPRNPQYNPEREVWKQDLLSFTVMTKFEGLDILGIEEGYPVSYVTFKAYLKQFDQAVTFTEKSRFEKVDDRWLYINGEVSPE